jgi:Fe-S-cluster containining protein
MTNQASREGNSVSVGEAAGEQVELDCLTCGACCFQRPGTILLSEDDLLRFARAERRDILEQLEPGHFSSMAFKMNEAGSCVFHGTAGEPHACQIYEDRGDVCREFQAGSPQCLEFRRDRGVGVGSE